MLAEKQRIAAESYGERPNDRYPPAEGRLVCLADVSIAGDSAYPRSSAGGATLCAVRERSRQADRWEHVAVGGACSLVAGTDRQASGLNP